MAGTAVQVGPRRRARTARLFAFDRSFGVGVIAGIDEVGRGCLAGPLVVAGVVIDLAGISHAARRALTGIDDSKRLPRDERERLAAAIVRHCPTVVVMSASPATIDRDGLHVTNVRLVRQVAARLSAVAELCLVDGRPIPGQMPAHTAVVGADRRSACVAAASIVAKSTRDRMMCGPADDAYPAYGFVDHVGYGTSRHRKSLSREGPCPLHRYSFAPVTMATSQTPTGAHRSDGDGPTTGAAGDSRSAATIAADDLTAADGPSATRG